MPEHTPDYSRKWLVMASVAAGLFLATIDGSIVNIALPILQQDLHTSFAAVEWVVLGYLLVVVTLMLVVGRLADMFGRKWIYLAGFLIFTLGSAFCGLSNSIGMLIGFRIFQGIGAAMLMALGTAIITDAFPPSERGRALGISGLMVSIGAVSGPTLGGLILGALSWHVIFFVNIPIGIIGSLMGARFIPANKGKHGETFDFPGAGLLFTMLLCVLLALTLGQGLGFASPPILSLFGVSALALVFFILRERKVRHPLIDFSLFTNKLFSINLITGFLTFVSSAGVVLLMPFFLQNVLMLQPEQAGALLVTVPISMGIMAPISGWLSDRFGTRPLTVIGLAFLLIGYIAASTLTPQVNMLGYVLRFIPIGVGMGTFQSPNNSAIMGSAPRERLGVASGLLSLTRTIGQTTGIAIMGAIWASRVDALAGMPASAAATEAPAAIQAAALVQTVYVIIALIFAALLLSIWAFFKDRSMARKENPVVEPPLI